MSVGDRLRQARKDNKMTLAQLGKLVGVTGGAVTAWESGRNIPDAVMLTKLAAALNVTLNWLAEAPAQEEYTISDEVYQIATIIDSLPDKDRQTMLNVLHALGYSAKSGAKVVPRKEGNQGNRN